MDEQTPPKQSLDVAPSKVEIDAMGWATRPITTMESCAKDAQGVGRPADEQRSAVTLLYVPCHGLPLRKHRDYMQIT
jgi:hypothetical protein